MNKYKLIKLPVFLLVALIMLSGCGNDTYAIEKKFWHLKQKAQKIYQNPDASPPNELQRTVELFKKFYTDHAKNNLSIDAEFEIAKLYLAKKEYSDCRKFLKEMASRHTDNDNLLAEISFFSANTFEKENKWGEALNGYRAIIEKFPTTVRGISIPTYIAEYYHSKFQPDKSIEAFKDAANHYLGLANKYPNTPMSFNMHILAVQCYSAIKDWPQTVAMMDLILEKYKGKINLEELYLNKALICLHQLKDKVKAKETVEALLKEYPKTKLKKAAEAFLDKISKDAP